MFIVTTTNDGVTFWLRSTTWAFGANRADKFPTRDAAQAALAKAKQFMKAKAFKAAQIVEVQS